MKIIIVDNYGRDSVSDEIFAENVHPHYVQEIVDYLNARHGGENSQVFFKAVSNEHKLYEAKLL